MALDVGEQSFEQKVLARSHEVPVIADFWAEWCGPCHALAPVLEREVETRDGAVDLVKIDVDANQALAASYGIRGIPAVKGFRNGHVVAEFVGAVGPPAVASFVDQLLAPRPIEVALDDLRSRGDLPEVLTALEAGDEERALELIMTAIAEAPPDGRDRLRELAVAVFDHLGPEDPIAAAYRRRLASALY